MNLKGIMLNTENPKMLGEFYTKVFGEPGWQDGDYYGFKIGNGNIMVGPHSDVKGKNDTPGRLLIAFETPDVKTEFDRVKQLGATVIAEPYQPDQDNSPKTWLATLADPDNNYLQLSTPWEQ